MDRFLIKKPPSTAITITNQKLNDEIDVISPGTSQSDADIPAASVSISEENLTSGEESLQETEEQSELTHRRKQKSYKQKYKAKWTSNEDFLYWLEKTAQNQTKCRVCNKILAGGITHIRRHSQTATHSRLVQASRKTPSISKSFECDRVKQFNDKVREGEIKLILFLAEHNLPFLLLDHLSKLLPSICTDSEIAKSVNLSRFKGTALCANLIGPHNLEMLSKDLKENYFSLIIDETTDIGSKKSLAVVARYFKEAAGETQDRFLALLEVADGTAKGLYSAIKKFLTKLHIPQKNMLGFAADNANVMMGNKTGIQALFKEEQHNIFILGCVCHSFHLASSAACCKLPNSIEQLCKDICNNFAHSTKKIDQLRECQVFLDLKPHKMLRVSQTRWLSLENVVNRILEQWHALVFHFTSAVAEDAKSTNSITILNSLNNDIFKLYFSFLSYVLSMVNKLNIEFQSEHPKIHKLISRITELYTTLLKNFIKHEVFEDRTCKLGNENLDKFEKIGNINLWEPKNYKNINEIYIGAKCELIIQNNPNIDKNEVYNLKVRCLDFYKVLCVQIKKRFSFNDPVLKFLQNLDPTVVLSGKVTSIVSIVNHFPNLVDNLEELNSEWRQLPDIEELKSLEKSDLCKFWSTVFQMKNGMDALMFPNINLLVKGLLSLPHSSAAAERIFSQLNLIKSKMRNKLMVKTCDALIHTKELLNNNTCYDFKIPPALINRTFSIYNNTNNSGDDENLSF